MVHELKDAVEFRLGHLAESIHWSTPFTVSDGFRRDMEWILGASSLRQLRSKNQVAAELLAYDQFGNTEWWTECQVELYVLLVKQSSTALKAHILMNDSGVVHTMAQMSDTSLGSAETERWRQANGTSELQEALSSFTRSRLADGMFADEFQGFVVFGDRADDEDLHVALRMIFELDQAGIHVARNSTFAAS